ncbi:MAG: hypothetical protein ACLSAM_04400 [Alistipes onderdonkii]
MARILFAALLLLFTLPAAAQTPGDSIAFVTADWHTTDLGRGAACRYAQVEMFGSRQSIRSSATRTALRHADRTARRQG